MGWKETEQVRKKNSVAQYGATECQSLEWNCNKEEKILFSIKYVKCFLSPFAS